ncbi:FG-GAP repeat domain-containing protein [Streptomyces sp. NPDC019443]|uniref:FG-GAP repeat domain-containing protein n=1 Tax=Streptomyces sp. NPDC019443 TaxID=3365061 RepID=UPI0037AF5905
MRGAVAATISLSLAAGLGSAAAQAEAGVVSVTPEDAVEIPATFTTQKGSMHLVETGNPLYADGAGRLGFFHRDSGTGHYFWTRYSDGQSFSANPTGTGWGSARGTGTDTIVYFGNRSIQLRDMAAGTTRFITVPQGFVFGGAYGNTILAVKTVTEESGGTTTTKAVEPQLLDVAEDGVVRSRPVEGLPEGAEMIWPGASAGGDSQSILLRLKVDGIPRLANIDVATARMTGHTQLLDRPAVLLSPRHVAWYTVGTGQSEIRVVPRSDLGAEPTVLPAPLGADRYSYEIAIVGDWVIHFKGPGQPVMATPMNGGEPRRLLKDSALRLASAEDGSATIVGGATGTADWGAYRITEGADGSPVVTRVVDLSPVPATVQGLAAGGGTLFLGDNSSGKRHAYTRELRVQGTPEYGQRGPVMPLGGDCLPSAPDCHQLYSDGGDMVSLTHRADGDDQITTRYGGVVPTGLSGGTITDAADHYVVYTHKGTNQQIVYNTRGGTEKKVLTRTPVASALWADTLWSATGGSGTGSGTVTAYDLAAKKPAGEIDTGSGCTHEELQALGRWLYWSCGTRAGVYDRTAKKSVPVPADEALLGDGYLVRHNKSDGKLELTDFSSGTAVDRPLADFPATQRPQRRVTWTVDKSGGHVAYADSAQRVHVVPMGVATQPLSGWRTLYRHTGSGPWDSHNPSDLTDTGLFSVRLSKPVRDWAVTLEDPRTGKIVSTQTGGEARHTLRAEWSGLSDSGTRLANGRYIWTVTARPADGHGASGVWSGTFQQMYGTPAWRDLDGRDAIGDLITLSRGNPVMSIRPGRSNGTIGGYEGGPALDDRAKIVPMGDLNGDRCNDFLVRRWPGRLYLMDGGCTRHLWGDVPDKLVGSSGWNQFDVMVSPGDLTGDGRPDMLARQTTTGDLFLYAANASGGGVRAGVLIGKGWKGLMTVGAGDLNGDGKGDVLTRDASGALWRYNGTGGGTLTNRVKVGSGWQIYNAVVGIGDLSGDGRADLVARDTVGVLWRYNGTGQGTFTARVKIGTGWQKYAELF